jgi:hypothetical protein
MHGHLGEGELGRRDRDRDGIVEHSEVITMMTQGLAAGCWLLAISKAPNWRQAALGPSFMERKACFIRAVAVCGRGAASAAGTRRTTEREWRFDGNLCHGNYRDGRGRKKEAGSAS